MDQAATPEQIAIAKDVVQAHIDAATEIGRLFSNWIDAMLEWANSLPPEIIEALEALEAADAAESTRHVMMGHPYE